MTIKNISPGVRNRPADRDSHCLRADVLNAVPGAERGVLGRTIPVQKILRSALFEYFPAPLWVKRLASDYQIPQPTESSWNLTRHLIKQRRRQEESIDVLLAELSYEFRRREQHRLRNSDQGGTVKERPP